MNPAPEAAEELLSLALIGLSTIAILGLILLSGLIPWGAMVERNTFSPLSV